MLTVFIFLRVEKKSLKDYGLRLEKTSFLKFGLGLGTGLIIAFVLMFSQILYSDLILTKNPDVKVLPFLFWSLAFIPLAYMEEIAFRSYPLILLNKTFGLRTTQFILAILFALYHILMNWSVQSAFLGPGIWAFVYVLAAIWSNGIALPTGLHFGLNFVQSVLGGQKGIEALWHINYPSNVSDSAIEANENFGFALQILVLVLGIVATEYYIRKKRNKRNSLYH